MNAPQPDAVPEFPVRLADVPDEAIVPVLLAGYHDRLFYAAAHRGRQPAVDGLDAEHGRHALAALVLGQTIVETFLEERWPVLRDALAAGLPVEQLAAAIRVEARELLDGLTGWAATEHAAGYLPAAEYDAVLTLAERGSR